MKLVIEVTEEAYEAAMAMLRWRAYRGNLSYGEYLSVHAGEDEHDVAFLCRIENIDLEV